METSTLVGLLALVGLVATVALAVYRARIVAGETTRHAKFIAEYRFPRELSRRLHERRPALDEAQRELVLEGLRQYFLACLVARNGAIAKQLGMPSKAVDDAWHEFIVMTGLRSLLHRGIRALPAPHAEAADAGADRQCARQHAAPVAAPGDGRAHLGDAGGDAPLRPGSRVVPGRRTPLRCPCARGARGEATRARRQQRWRDRVDHNRRFGLRLRERVVRRWRGGGGGS